ncbi:MAG: hypothetical protein MJ223_03435 [Mycoplasmoidaceae bacterium]|nr:hypothetical protein [Mycoplasmoidaceae bacterium]
MIPTCNNLYAGIITDTARFLYPSVTPRTLGIAAELINRGCNRQKIHDAVYLRDLDEIKFSIYVLKRTHFDNELGFA